MPPRAQAAHQQAVHMLAQIRRRLAGEPLKPFVYRDFGSLVSLGEYSTVGSLMGFLAGRSMWVEGLFRAADVPIAVQDARARLHGTVKTALSSFGAHADPAHRAAGEAALTPPCCGAQRPRA